MSFSNPLIWTIVFLVILGTEMALNTIYLLALAAGALAGALLAFTDCSLAVQLSAAGIVTVIASFFAHVFRARRRDFGKSHEDLDKGNTVIVKTVKDDGTAQVSYRGASWSARETAGGALTPGVYHIAAIEGSTLLLKK